VVVLDGEAAGTLDGIRRLSYRRHRAAVTDAELSRAAITNARHRRGPFPHFLLKELTEAPRSFRQDAAGVASRSATACCAPALGPMPCRRR